MGAPRGLEFDKSRIRIYARHGSVQVIEFVNAIGIDMVPVWGTINVFAFLKQLDFNLDALQEKLCCASVTTVQMSCARYESVIYVNVSFDRIVRTEKVKVSRGI